MLITNTATADSNYQNTFDANIQNGFSVTFWEKGFPGSWNPYVSKNGETPGFQVRRHASDNYPCFTLRGTPGTDDPTDASSLNVNNNNWHYFDATWEGVAGVRHLYVDNVLWSTVTGDTGPFTLATTCHLMLGGKQNYNSNGTQGTYGNWFAGKLYDVRFYSGALTTAEVAYNFIGANTMSLAKSGTNNVLELAQWLPAVGTSVIRAVDLGSQ